MQPVAARREPSPEELAETFALLRRIGLGIRGRFQQAMSEHGLTYPQWLVLKALREAGRVPAAELAAKLGVTPANVTGLVGRLEREGLVARERSADDRRVVFVQLTDAGRAKIRAIQERGANAILAEAFAGWTSEDLAALREMLGRMRIGDAPDC